MFAARPLALVALTAIGSGCTAWVDGVTSDAEQDRGLSTQTTLECHESADPTVEACPPACTGGCDAGTCRISCATDEACKDAVIECPAGLHCLLTCIARKSCEKAEVLCPESTTCEVLCAGDDACKETVVVAGERGPVSLACDGQPHECHDTTLLCGANACLATCADKERPNLECNDSCNCQPCTAPTPPTDD